MVESWDLVKILSLRFNIYEKTMDHALNYFTKIWSNTDLRKLGKGVRTKMVCKKKVRTRNGKTQFFKPQKLIKNTK